MKTISYLQVKNEKSDTGAVRKKDCEGIEQLRKYKKEEAMDYQEIARQILEKNRWERKSDFGSTLCNEIKTCYRRQRKV